MLTIFIFLFIIYLFIKIFKRHTLRNIAFRNIVKWTSAKWFNHS